VVKPWCREPARQTRLMFAQRSSSAPTSTSIASSRFRAKPGRSITQSAMEATIFDRSNQGVANMFGCWCGAGSDVAVALLNVARPHAQPTAASPPPCPVPRDNATRKLRITLELLMLVE
jgi:hypothetical protein